MFTAGHLCIINSLQHTLLADSDVDDYTDVYLPATITHDHHMMIMHVIAVNSDLAAIAPDPL